MMEKISVQPELVTQLLEHRDVLLSFVFSLTRDFDAAEEVFQEVSLAMLHEAGKGTQVSQGFMVWAREVARRRVAEYYRKATKVQLFGQLPDSLAESIDRVFNDNEAVLEAQQDQMTHLLECLKRISGRSREVVEGFYRRRQSLKEIAAALGWQYESVKVALSRARKALADCMQVRSSTAN